MKFQKIEWVALAIVMIMVVAANLPEDLRGHLFDRKLVLFTLVSVTVIAMFRYVQYLLLAIISILAFGANLPQHIAADLGISQPVLLVALGALIAITLLNRKYKLLATNRGEEEQAEEPDEDDTLRLDQTGSRQLMMVSIAKGDIATVRKLIAARKDTINFTLNGTTPLHLATEKGYSSIVELLIENGADVLAMNAAGQTPLDAALAVKKYARTTDILFNATMPLLKDQFKERIASANQ